MTVQTPRVLVVDDDTGTLLTYGAILQFAGYEVDTATSGAKGLSACFHDEPDILIVELHLPDMNGLDLLRSLRQASVLAPCVVVTGFGTFQTAVEALRLGVRNYLEKPLTETQLVLAIRDLVTPTREGPLSDCDRLALLCHVHAL